MTVLWNYIPGFILLWGATGAEIIPVSSGVAVVVVVLIVLVPVLVVVFPNSPVRHPGGHPLYETVQ